MRATCPVHCSLQDLITLTLGWKTEVRCGEVHRYDLAGGHQTQLYCRGRAHAELVRLWRMCCGGWQGLLRFFLGWARRLSRNFLRESRRTSAVTNSLQMCVPLGQLLYVQEC